MVTEARLEGKFRVLKQQLAILDSVLSKLDNLDNLVTYLNSFFFSNSGLKYVYSNNVFLPQLHETATHLYVSRMY